MFGSLIKLGLIDSYQKGSALFSQLNRKMKRLLLHSSKREKYFVVSSDFRSGDAIQEIGRRCHIPVRITCPDAALVQFVKVDHIYDQNEFELVVSNIVKDIKSAHVTRFGWTPVGRVDGSNCVIVRFTF